MHRMHGLYLYSVHMCSLLFSFEVMSLLRSSWFYELGIILLSKHFLEWSVGCVRLPKFWLSPVHWETHGHICVCVCVCCLPGFQKDRSTSTVRPARWSWRPAIEIMTVVKYDRLKNITLQGKRNLTKRNMATVSLWQVSYLAASRTSHDQLAQLVLHTIGHIEQTLTAGPEWSRYIYIEFPVFHRELTTGSQVLVPSLRGRAWREMKLLLYCMQIRVFKALIRVLTCYMTWKIWNDNDLSSTRILDRIILVLHSDAVTSKAVTGVFTQLHRPTTVQKSCSRSLAPLWIKIIKNHQIYQINMISFIILQTPQHQNGLDHLGPDCDRLQWELARRQEGSTLCLCKIALRFTKRTARSTTTWSMPFGRLVASLSLSCAVASDCREVAGACFPGIPKNLAVFARICNTEVEWEDMGG